MLAIARALLGNPRLLLIDEPSDGLAPIVVEQVTGVIKALCSDGVSVLLVEQDLAAALEVADDVSVMDKGAIVHASTAEAFRREPEQIGQLLGIA